MFFSSSKSYKVYAAGQNLTYAAFLCLICCKRDDVKLDLPGPPPRLAYSTQPVKAVQPLSELNAAVTGFGGSSPHLWIVSQELPILGLK